MTLEEVAEKIGRANLQAFSEWMYGQTSGLVNGMVDYYEHDVEVFMEQHRDSNLSTE